MGKMKDNAIANKTKSLWSEFKKFITRGNVVDMAVGVIIGGAFSAIVTALVNILLSLCTWGIPGGIKGLVTVLPAANAAQAGVTGIGQSFQAANLADNTIAFAASQGVTITSSDSTFIQWQNALLSKYTLHGTSYFYNASAIIDWGSFINAIISFLIIALTLFVIVKIVKTLQQKRAEFNAQLLEQYYVKHPEERPAPVVPGAPAPTQMDILVQIRDELKKQNATDSSEKK